ncbi:MAG: ABC transporter ATP-binding protein [Anaerovorax sp.]
MKKLLKYYKPYKVAIAGALLLLLLQVLSDLALPNYMAKIINNGIIPGDIRYIFTAGIQMLALALICTLCAGGVGFFAARIGAKSSMKIRSDVFRKVSDFANPEFDKFSTASLITRSTNDIQQIQMLVIVMFRMVLMAPMMGIGALFMAYKNSPSMTWTIVLALMVVLGLLGSLFALTTPKFKLVQKLVDRLNLVMNERLTGILVIRAFNTEVHEEARFDETNEQLTKLNLFVNRVMMFMMPMMMLVMNGVSILILWTGAKRIDQNLLAVGDMLAFIQYTMLVIMSFMMVSMVFVMMPRALVSAQRISEVLETEVSIIDTKTPACFNESLEKTGYIEFRQVSFKYPDAQDYVLKDLNFIAKPGETTALIGSTGSGKTTVVNLIPRFYDVTEGQILINGTDIRRFSQKDLREQIGYVPQKAVLFTGTIESNILYGVNGAACGADAMKSVAYNGAKTAQALDFIKEKPQGFETEVSQGGTNVSGGQKQRLSIARALAKKPPIYIFDDSFSALDFQTDNALRRALKEETGDSTILIVAQRISTIKNAEQIIVMDDGKIVGKGTHGQLLKECNVYKEIASSQLDEKELDYE